MTKDGNIEGLQTAFSVPHVTYDLTTPSSCQLIDDLIIYRCSSFCLFSGT